MRSFTNPFWIGNKLDNYEKVHECYKCQLKIIDPSSEVIKTLISEGAKIVKMIDPKSGLKEITNSITIPIKLSDIKSVDFDVELRSIKIDSKYDYECEFPPNCMIYVNSKVVETK